MSSNKYHFEFLPLSQQRKIIEEGKFIDVLHQDDFKILLFWCENSYYAEVFMKENENEIDFISLASPERLQKYHID